MSISDQFKGLYRQIRLIIRLKRTKQDHSFCALFLQAVSSRALRVKSMLKKIFLSYSLFITSFPFYICIVPLQNPVNTLRLYELERLPSCSILQQKVL